MTQVKFAVADSPKTKNLPEVIVKLLAGKMTLETEMEMNSVGRGGGIFTKEDVFTLKQYAKKGSSLPTTLADIENYLGYKKSGIAGLEPKDIQILYKEIKIHTQSWNTIENGVKLQNKYLELTANNILTSGRNILTTIEAMPIIDQVKTTVGGAGKFTYSKDDQVIADALLTILGDMRKDIDAAQKKTAVVKDNISDFKITLIGGKLANGTTAKGLEPQIKFKDSLMQKNNLKETVKNYQKDINNKKKPN